MTVTPGTNPASGPPRASRVGPDVPSEIPTGKLPSPLDDQKPPQDVAPSSLIPTGGDH